MRSNTFIYVILSMLLPIAILAQVKVGSNAMTIEGSALFEMESTTQGFLSPRMSESQRDGISNPAEGLLIYCLDCDPKTHYYYNGSEWTTLGGMPSNGDSFMGGGFPSTSRSVSSQEEGGLIEIGDIHEGGVVFYLFQVGDPGYVSGEQHGLIVSMTDQSSTAVSGGCAGTIAGASGDGLGTGETNTQAMVNNCPEIATAASICNELESNGYSDWYLPSPQEQQKLYESRTKVSAAATSNGGIGINANANYWNSREHSATQGSVMNMLDGSNSLAAKAEPAGYVRAIRTF